MPSDAADLMAMASAIRGEETESYKSVSRHPDWPQHIHEKIEPMILVGGKQTIFLKLTIAFVMFSNSSMLTGAESGIRLRLPAHRGMRKGDGWWFPPHGILDNRCLP
ncbi:hypothetical protein DY000_02035663 [Brassica cretica]|uniref:Uncharacterized protein n=2 Tax=Brassica cretica TaxID=69181 RepID=A0ABQ7DMY1_BRACR|nr:hypothetical protein DY000_02035663 [Brassica cretica]